MQPLGVAATGVRQVVESVLTETRRQLRSESRPPLARDARSGNQPSSSPTGIAVIQDKCAGRRATSSTILCHPQLDAIAVTSNYPHYYRIRRYNCT